MLLSLRLMLFSSLALILSAQASAGVVSVEELRNPHAGKSLRAIITVQEHLKSGQRDRGIQELRQAVQHLQAAAQELPSAHLELAKHYDRAGRAPDAESERRAYEITSMGLLAAK